MQALDLNLSSRPFKNNTLLWAGYSSALVLLIVFAVWNVSTWRNSVTKIKDLSDEVSSIEGRLSELDQRDLASATGIGGYDVKMLAVQAEKANEVIDWKAFSWTRLFNLMEEVLPYDVRMSSIRPLFHAGRHRGEMDAEAQKRAQTVPVVVEGIAKDFRAVWEMQNALLDDRHFGRVFPERLQRTDRGEIVFSITFLYHPDVVEEEEVLAEIPQVPAEKESAGPDGPAVPEEDEGSTGPGDVASAEGPTPDGAGPPPSAEPPAEAAPLAAATEGPETPKDSEGASGARQNQAAASQDAAAAARAERIRQTNQAKRLLRRSAQRPTRPAATGSQKGSGQAKGQAEAQPQGQAEAQPQGQAEAQPQGQADEKEQKEREPE